VKNNTKKNNKNNKNDKQMTKNPEQKHQKQWNIKASLHFLRSAKKD
jgi:hypothetical protein